MLLVLANYKLIRLNSIVTCTSCCIVLSLIYFMEIWKDVPNYEGLYQVSNLGNVKSLSKIINDKKLKEKLLTPCKNSGGYLWVKFTINKIEKSFSVHRLVALTFLGESKLVVNHKDLNKLNNSLENLEYLSQRENNHHYTSTLKKSSKYIGVIWDKHRNKWMAKIKKNGKSFHIGRFDNELEASNAYQNALKKILCN